MGLIPSAFGGRSQQPLSSTSTQLLDGLQTRVTPTTPPPPNALPPNALPAYAAPPCSPHDVGRLLFDLSVCCALVHAVHAASPS